MTAGQARRQAMALLANHRIEDAPLEAELLLQHVLGWGRAEIYAGQDEELLSEQEIAFWQLVGRRLGREPTAYILGRREFFGLEFYVDSRVLIPRPESELLVEKSLEMVEKHLSGGALWLADIGTGSGALAIALAVNLPQAQVYATDVSPRALEVAGINCRRHGVGHRVQLLLGDMLSPLPQAVDLMVANLPYVREGELRALAPEVRLFEPSLALAGGRDGLDRIRQFLAQVPQKLNPRGSFLLEVGLGQGARVGDLVESCFPQARVELAADLAGIDRVVMAVFP